MALSAMCCSINGTQCHSKHQMLNICAYGEFFLGE